MKSEVEFMRKHKFWEIDRRENSGHVDSWMEYLCLEKSGGGNFVLSIKSHVIIDSEYNGEIISQFYNEGTDEYDLPDEINGIKVLGWSAEFLLGVELENNFQYTRLELAQNDFEQSIRQWMKEINWDVTAQHLSLIKKIICQ
jgi:hypothetical protein